jgi:hypothetical protein
MCKLCWKEVVIILAACTLCAGWILFGINYHNIKNLYGMTAIVTNVSQATDTVTIEDFNGNLWQFEGIEDWAVNDVVSCVMDGQGTDLIKDDVIIKVQYSGYFEGWTR